jgi:hypothetical protein
VIAGFGHKLVRAHPYKPELKHGFIDSQKEGMEVFATVDPDAPIIVAEAVWQYSHHLLAGLISHRGPILTVANWSGTWPGLVGMLNLNGSLTKAGVKYSTLWSEDFTDEPFRQRACANGSRPAWSSTAPESRASRSRKRAKVPPKARALARVDRRRPAPRKVDHGCLRRGMHGHVQRHHSGRAAAPTGVFKERLSQSALYYGATQVE